MKNYEELIVNSVFDKKYDEGITYILQNLKYTETITK